MIRFLMALLLLVLGFTVPATAQPQLNAYVYGSAFYIDASTPDPAAWNCRVAYTLSYVQYGEPGSQTFQRSFYIPRRSAGNVYLHQTPWAASTLSLTGLQGPFCSQAALKRRTLVQSRNVATTRRGVLMFTTVAGAPPTEKWSTNVDAPTLPSHVDGKIKSISVGEAPVYFFDQPNFGGQRLAIVRGGGCDDLSRCIPGAGNWSNRIRSIKFPTTAELSSSSVSSFAFARPNQVTALDVPDYNWYNGTSQNVRLKFTYLDGNLEPTGQVNTYGVAPGEWYETRFGYNTYAYVSVINGRALDWDPSNDIFGMGYTGSGNFHIGPR